ncbi:MAG TPA: LuxR C-terminal-related transcriptional regulator [Polyangiaceae bacterium]|nr:LuxR C-terminal-related transcriptional regulator [Polyangiaceae bacterium]
MRYAAESRVACLMVRGAADKEIAIELGMTLHSARTYAARVLKRMGVQSRRELMRSRG